MKDREAEQERWTADFAASHATDRRGPEPQPTAPGAAGYEGALLRAARRETTWEVDVVPFPVAVDDDPSARPAALIVMAGEYAMTCEAQARPPGEIADLARMMADAVNAVAARTGAFPEQLFVRHFDVAAALAGHFEGSDMNIGYDPVLSWLDEFSTGLLDEDQRAAGRPLIALPALWAGWGLPPEEVAALFDAAAAFHRAAPWIVLAEQQILETELPGGDEWYVSIIGKEGGFPGIALHREFHDAILCASEPASAEVARAIEDRHYFIDFNPRDGLPREMQREIALRNWSVAAPDAYPMLMSANTPGGGITGTDARAIALLLAAVARLAESGDVPALVAPHPDAEAVWDDLESGVRFWHPAAQVAEELDEIAAERERESAGGPFGAMPPELRDEVRAVLEPVLQRDELPGKEELDRIVEGVIEKLNARPQEALGGLSPGQMHALLRQDWEKDDAPLVLHRSLPLDEFLESEIFWSARAFLAALVREEGVPATVAGNLNRAFVRTMIGEGRWSGLHWKYLDPDEKVINEQDFWPLHALRILLSMAGLIRKYRKRFVVTRLGAELVDDGRAGELYARLFRVRFREMNLGYGDRHRMGEELQQTLPFILFRMADAAKEWTTATALVPQVLLPEVRSAYPEHPWLTVESVLEHRVLDRLCDFGLAERDPVSDIVLAPERARYRLTPLFGRFLEFRPG